MDMSFFGRLARTLMTAAVVIGFSLILAQTLTPEGHTLADLPEVMRLIRDRTPNPLAQQILSWIIGEEKAEKLANDVNDDQAPKAQRQLGVGDEVLDQATARNAGVVTGAVIDPQILAAIDRLLLAPELKRQLRESYLRTGQAPGLSGLPGATESPSVRQPAASQLNAPGLIWPTRSLQAMVAVTVGALSEDEARPKLKTRELEAQADTLLAKIHASLGPENALELSSSAPHHTYHLATQAVLFALLP
ncbi:MAG: hypothetical protein NDI61_04620 [Bdellovibrionaceae bacterium]|nr:hypothetical protein [Pseudobdellovibrionaceae bacterium]